MDRISREAVEAAYHLAIDAATGAGIDTSGWDLVIGSGSCGWRLIGCRGLDIGRTHGNIGNNAREARATLLALAGAWQVAANARRDDNA